MTDAEWQSWQSNWSGATGPLPDVRARARKQMSVHLRANVAFFLLVAIGLAGSIPAFRDRHVASSGIGWAIVGFCVAMGLGYAMIQRGLRGRDGGNPRDDLAFLERRLQIERRTAHLVRWVHAALAAVFFVLFPRVVEGDRDANLQIAIVYPGAVLMLLGTFSAPWWVARRNRRYQEEIDGWRRWMDEQHL